MDKVTRNRTRLETHQKPSSHFWSFCGEVRNSWPSNYKFAVFLIHQIWFCFFHCQLRLFLSSSTYLWWDSKCWQRTSCKVDRIVRGECAVAAQVFWKHHQLRSREYCWSSQCQWHYAMSKYWGYSGDRERMEILNGNID